MTQNPKTASAWIAETFLRVARGVREFNAAQVELHERWWRRYGGTVRSQQAEPEQDDPPSSMSHAPAADTRGDLRAGVEPRG